MSFLYKFKYFNTKALFLLFISSFFTQATKPEIPNDVASFLKSAFSYSLGVSLTGVCGLGIKEKIRFLREELTKLENKRIEDWIVKNNLNAYGDSQDTIYNNGCPLLSNQTRYEYLVNKFPDKPWFKDYENLIKIINSINTFSTGMVAVGYGAFIIGPLVCLSIWAFYEMRYMRDHPWVS